MVRPVVEAAGLELVEATLVREQGHRTLRVTVDREGGVDLDAIGEVSERISRRLDVEGFDPGPYSLEVSSPGVERPLREPRQFVRAVGERIKVRLRAAAEGHRSLEGVLAEATQTGIHLATEEGDQTLAYDDIASARTVHDWVQDLKDARNR